MERASTLQLTPTERVEVDFALASRILRPLAGRFYAVEIPGPESLGSIWLPDCVATSLRSDLVVVLAAGTGVGLLPGDLVVVRPTHGDWIDDARFGLYVAEGRVRIYGMACEHQGEPSRVDWDECAPARMKGGRLEATGRNVLLRRDPVQRSERGVLLTDESAYRSGLGTVVSIGAEVREVAVGNRVHYNPLALLDFMFGEDPDLAVCTEMAINAVLLDA